MNEPPKKPAAGTSDQPVKVTCPHCNAVHQVRAAVLGKLTKCTSCKQQFVLRPTEEKPSRPAATKNQPAPPQVAKPVAQRSNISEEDLDGLFGPVSASGVSQPPPQLTPPPALAAATLASTETSLAEGMLPSAKVRDRSDLRLVFPQLELPFYEKVAHLAGWAVALSVFSFVLVLVWAILWIIVILVTTIPLNVFSTIS